MSFEIDDGEKIEAILEWAETNPRFDPSFVEDLAERYDNFGELTPAQSAALDRIIEGFQIEI